MKKMLIVGQSLSELFPGSRSWSKGRSSKRLRSWFGFKNYMSMSKKFDMINVEPDFNSMKKLLDIITKKEYDKIFLVGKKAQHVFLPVYDVELGWKQLGFLKCCFIPHPSGRNFSCNRRDKEIISMIKEVI